MWNWPGIVRDIIGVLTGSYQRAAAPCRAYCIFNIMADLIWAIAHHLLAFGIFGLLFAEFIALRGTLNEGAVRRIAALDLWYGLLAGVMVIIGLSRANFAAKGWVYYSHNGFFWAKLSVFAAIALLSIPPTLAFNRWKRTATLPDVAALRTVRRYMHIELTLFVLLPVFAAAMARGFGEF
jgi:putative membrane protein